MVKGRTERANSLFCKQIDVRVKAQSVSWTPQKVRRVASTSNKILLKQRSRRGRLLILSPNMQLSTSCLLLLTFALS